MIQKMALWAARFILWCFEWFLAVFMPDSYMDWYKSGCGYDPVISFTVDD